MKFDLLVFSAQIFERSVDPSPKIAGAIHELARRKRILYESLGSKIVSVQIARGQARAGYEYLARRIVAYRIERLVQQVDLSIGRGSTDRYGWASIDARPELINHAADGCFGGSIFVVDANRPTKGVEDVFGELQP